MIMSCSLHKIWWLWIPLIFLVIQIGLELILDTPTLAILHSEAGPHEFLQFVIVTIAFFVAVMTVMRTDVRETPWLAAWAGLAALCCFYVAGEEVSWGQHIFDWATPDFWQEVNDQQETNLHNTSSWLDQKPRLILEIGVIVGGVIIPLLRRFRSAWLPQRFAFLYPSNHFMVIAGVFLAIKVADMIADSIGIILFERSSEVIELYLFYFVLLYLVDFRRKIIA